MTFLSSITNLLRWTSIFTIVMTFAWQDVGVSQSPALSVPASRLAAARSVVHEAVEEAKALRTDQERGALSNLAKAQAKTGDISGAQQTLAKLPELPDKRNMSWAIQEIAVAQAIAGDISSARRTVSTIPEKSAQVEALQGIARVQVSRGDIAGALQTVGLFNENWVGSRLLLAVAQAQADAGDFTGAINTARMAPKDFELDSFVAMAHARNGNVAEAVSTARTIQSDKRLFLYVTLAAYQAKANDIPGALRLADEIPEGIRFGLRDLAFYGVVLAQASAGDLAGARSTVARLKEPVIQNMATAAIFGAQARKGDEVGALAAAQAVPDLEARAVALAGIAAAQAKAGNVAGAIRTAVGIPDIRGPTGFIDSQQRSMAFAKIAEIQADRGDRSGAWTTTSMISETGRRNFAEERVALVVARAGDPDRLIAIKRRNSTAYSRVIALCDSAEDILKNPTDNPGIHNLFPPDLWP
jgi:hypothetical protein